MKSVGRRGEKTPASLVFKKVKDRKGHFRRTRNSGRAIYRRKKKDRGKKGKKPSCLPEEGSPPSL